MNIWAICMSNRELLDLPRILYFLPPLFTTETHNPFSILYLIDYFQFGFKSIPNLVVSRPEMPLISDIEKKQYLQKYKWAISYSDGDVTTHKMLDFVNQRTGHNVFYKPTFKTMLFMFFGFIFVMATGVLIYTKLRWLWTHWLVWFLGVLAIYITCVSGVVYDIIHNVPFVGRDKNTGEAQIFTSGVNIILYRHVNSMELKDLLFLLPSPWLAFFSFRLSSFLRNLTTPLNQECGE